MSRRKLSEDEIAEKLRDLGGWQVEGIWLKKRYEFTDFAGALGFVNQVGVIAETVDHHPDITFGWGYANIDLTTHDSGGLTKNDFDVAEKIDAI